MKKKSKCLKCGKIIEEKYREYNDKHGCPYCGKMVKEKGSKCKSTIKKVSTKKGKVSNQKIKIGAAEFISGVGHPVAYYPRIALAIGSVKASIFICQLLYWQGKGKKGEWIYKSRKEMTEETGLSREEQDGARRLLKKLNILEEKLTGVPATTHYKINFNQFNEILNTYLIEKEKAEEKARKEKARK